MREIIKIIFSVLLFLVSVFFIGLGVYSSTQIINKPFPGFLLHYENIVNQSMLPYWGGYSKINYLDIVEEVNSKKVENSRQVALILSGVKEGSDVTYLIRRSNGEKINLSLPVMKFNILDFLLSFGINFIVALVAFIVGVVTYIKRPRLVLSFVFFMLTCVFAVWNSILLGGGIISPLLGGATWVSQLLLPAVLIHFGLAFLDDKKRSYLCVFPYFISLINLSLVFYAIYISKSPAFLVKVLSFSNYYMVAGFVVMFCSFLYVRVAGSTALLRQRARLLLLGVSVVSISGIVAVLFVFLKIKFALNLVLIPTTILPLLFAYTILRYNPFEVDSVIKKVLSTSVIIAMIVGTYYLFVFLSGPLGFEIYRWPVFSILFILFFLFGYDTLELLLSRFITRFILGYRVDFQKLTAKISDDISTLLDLGKIMHTLKAALLAPLRLKSMELLISYPNQEGFRNEDGTLSLLPKDELFGIITERKDNPLSVYDLLENPSYLSEKEKCIEKMKQLGAVLIIPMIFRDQLRGCLILGKREDRVLYYSLEELAFLKNVAFQATVAFQNAKLYENLEESKKVIEELHSGLEKKVEERTEEVKEKTSELDKLNVQLKLATERKSEFLANMSHELRTPLNAVLGFAELINSGVYGEVSENIKQAVAEMQKSGNHLLGLINDVLDLSSVEAGKIALKPTDFTVSDILELVKFSVKPLLDSKKLYLKIKMDKNLPVGYGDPKRINQVLINLIGNSAKFTKKGGITLYAKKKNDNLLFEVEDTGIGIAAEKLGDVFKEFKQVHVGEYGGTGLGLAICKKLVELHNGTICAESKPGKGTKFSFSIPIRAEGADQTKK